MFPAAAAAGGGSAGAGAAGATLARRKAKLYAGIVVHLAQKKVVGGVAPVHLLGGIRASTHGRVFLQISHIDGPFKLGNV